MKSFKKAALSICAAMMCIIALCGFDKNMTIDQVEEKFVEALKDQDSVSMDIDLAGEYSIRGKSAISGESRLAAGYRADVRLSASLHPLKVYVEAALEAGGLGIDTKGECTFYAIEKEDGRADLYYRASMMGDEFPWTHTECSKEDVEKLGSYISSGRSKLNNIPDLWRLGKTSRMVNGAECYQVLANLTYETIKEPLKEYMEEIRQDEGNPEMISESDWEMIGNMVSGLRWNCELDVNDTTFLPAASHYDMKGSNLDNLNMMLADLLRSELRSQGIDINFDITFSLDKMTMDTLYDYSPVTIDVPEEILNLPVE